MQFCRLRFAILQLRRLQRGDFFHYLQCCGGMLSSFIIIIVVEAREQFEDLNKNFDGFARVLIMI